MSVDRARIRELVRRELLKRTASSATDGERPHAALGTIHREAPEDAESAAARPCLIEPSKSCVDSGYCKKLGY